MEKPSIDPQNISMWIVAAVCFALIALALGGFVLHESRTHTLMIQGELLLLNKKIEDLRKVVQSAAAPPAGSSAPTQPAPLPAK